VLSMLRRNRVLVLAIAALLASPQASASAQEPSTPPRTDRGSAPASRAKAAAAGLQARLDAATRTYIQSREELVGVEADLRAAQAQVDSLAKRMAGARAVLAGQAAALYRSGGMTTASMVLGQQGGDVGDLADRLALADRVAARSRDKAAEATAIVAGYEASTKRLAEARARQRALVATQAGAVERLQADLAEAEERLRREEEAARRARERAAAEFARAEAARRAAERQAATSTTAPPTPATAPPAAPRPATSGNRACPVARPYSFIDSWGFARSGGRHHEGVDIMARHGTTVFAHAGGVVTKTTVNVGLGGTTVWIRDGAGTLYYYAHLSRFVVRTGQAVRTGQVVGAVGSTGNASASAPHLHFEIRPGGVPVNPYPFVKRVCP
jgi:murein DD-endopeptidase MepM/ murein hydrolase activator NlpD